MINHFVHVYQHIKQYINKKNPLYSQFNSNEETTPQPIFIDSDEDQEMSRSFQLPFNPTSNEINNLADEINDSTNNLLDNIDNMSLEDFKDVMSSTPGACL